jgi:hypothetical protein
MSYEPRGKMIDLIAAVRAEPQRIFRAPEVSAILCCKTFPSTIDQYLYAAAASGAVFKRQVDGAWYYAGSPISDLLLEKIGVSVQPRNGTAKLVPTGKRSPEEIAASLAHPLAPKMEPWSPPKMVAPRAGSDIPHRSAITQKAPPAASPAPQPAPKDASIPNGAVAEVDEHVDEEPVEFSASLWLDGDIVIYGATETEDGGILITKDQLARLKRLIAWSAM